MKEYQVVLLKGDGIGPEIVGQAARVLEKAGERFGFCMKFEEALLGGCAIDAAALNGMGCRATSARKRGCSASAARWACLPTSVRR